MTDMLQAIEQRARAFVRQCALAGKLWTKDHTTLEHTIVDLLLEQHRASVEYAAKRIAVRVDDELKR